MADPVKSEEDVVVEGLDDLEIAEYFLYVMSLQTYARWVEEEQESQEPGTIDKGSEQARDKHTLVGLKILAQIDAHITVPLKEFLSKEMASQTAQLKVMERAMSIHVGLSPEKLFQKCYRLQGALERNKAVTLKAMFKNSTKSVRMVTVALAASDRDPGPDVFAKYCSFTMHNSHVRDWIDAAYKIMGSAEIPQNPVDMAQVEAASQIKDIQKKQALVTAGSTTETLAADSTMGTQLSMVESNATETAKRALEISGAPDRVLTKSEVVGVATATVVAALSSADNLPPTIKKNVDDPEKIAAILTDGRVVMPAGAGAGKTATVEYRVEHLVVDRQVPMSRILICAFNREAAEELQSRVGKRLGDRAGDLSDNIGTIHSTFRKILTKYGNSNLKESLNRWGGSQNADGKRTGGAEYDTLRTATKIYRKMTSAYEDGKLKEGKLPSCAKRLVSFWKSNDIKPDAALAQAKFPAEFEAARFYAVYEYVKGTVTTLPDFGPNVPVEASQSVAGTTQDFNDKHRAVPGSDRLLPLYDMDDWLTLTRNLLKSNPRALADIQSKYDHVIVDEAQDLSKVQQEAFDLIAGHVDPEGKDGRSYWVVGDEKQAIYEWRGADPKLFQKRMSEWTARPLSTNYRCPPKVVEAANRLISHNEMDPFVAKASPFKDPAEGSIKLQSTPDQMMDSLFERLGEEDASYRDHAILTRTNNELDEYEMQLLVRGVPYTRKGAKAKFGTPPVNSFLSVVKMASEGNLKDVPELLTDAIYYPNRFFKRQDDRANVVKAVKAAIKASGLSGSEDPDVVSQLLQNPRFKNTLVQQAFTFRDGPRYDIMVEDLMAVFDTVQREGSTIKEALGTFVQSRTLDLESVRDASGNVRKREVYRTLEEQFTIEAENTAANDDNADEDESEEKGPNLGPLAMIGIISSKTSGDVVDEVLSPEDPKNFLAKVDRIKARAPELAIDYHKFMKAQKDAGVPYDQRVKPNAVYLGTIHSTKGAQWNSTYLTMTDKKFPSEYRPRGSEGMNRNEIRDRIDADPELQAEETAHYEAERRLAYVAFTRSKKTVNVSYKSGEAESRGKGGPSRFVSELGLLPGENVERPNHSVVEDIEETNGESPVIKTAWAEDSDNEPLPALYIPPAPDAGPALVSDLEPFTDLHPYEVV